MVNENKNDPNSEHDHGIDVPLSNVAYSSPAPYVNKFHVSLTNMATRIGFAEQNPFNLGQVEPRGAVFLSTSDAVELANIILGLFDKSKQNQPTDTASEQ